ncbi:MAG: hypothetical protein FJZ58_03090 [Chlamydiae bacterium]|nr:hypothetical protein [Chlamydiota bacterium]
MQQRSLFRCLLASSVTALATLSPLLYGDTIDRESESNEVDIQALREWINTKRQVSIKEIGGNLSLSGEVRTEFQTSGETRNGVSQRGTGTPFPSNQYDIAANILLDYKADQTWASIKLEFDNDAGIFSGSTNKIKLSRAYFGARVVDGEDCYVDTEVGRRKLSSAFDSKLEFGAYFDGALLKYSQAFDRIGDFYISTGVFIIDEKRNQYGYVGETGFMNILGSGVYTKYSLIDWDTKNLHNSLAQHRFDFLVSQLILGYKFYLNQLQKQVSLYSAVLYNARAKKLAITANKKANWGGYVGFSVGELKKQGDWSLDANYQLLEAQCVPDYDMNGIGIGNIIDSGLYTTFKNGTGEPTTNKTAAGDGNFQGFCVTLDYLLTNNLNLQQQWQYSVTLEQDIGPSRRFKQYEIEFIYGF